MPYKEYYVYILTNYNRTVLYTGVCNNLESRVWQHKNGINPGSFTRKYHVYLLVWYETHNDINEAIRREKLIKKWKRQWKEELINKENPDWEDLSKGWYD